MYCDSAASQIELPSQRQTQLLRGARKAKRRKLVSVSYD